MPGNQAPRLVFHNGFTLDFFAEVVFTFTRIGRAKQAVNYRCSQMKRIIFQRKSLMFSNNYTKKLVSSHVRTFIGLNFTFLPFAEVR